MGFTSGSLFPVSKQETVTQDGNQGERPPNVEDHPWSQYQQRLSGKARLWAHFRCIHIKQEKERGYPDPPKIEYYYFNYLTDGSLDSIVGEEGGVRRTELVLFLFYVSVSGKRPRSRLSSQPLTITVSWVLLRVGWSIHLAPPWVTASRFFVGNREAELKHTTFSSLLLLRVFLSFLFS